MKPVFRLKQPSMEVLEEYSSDPNEAIILLQNRVKVLQKANETFSNTSKTGQKPVEKPPFGVLTERFSPDLLPRDHPFWKTMGEVVDESIRKAKEGY